MRSLIVTGALLSLLAASCTTIPPGVRSVDPLLPEATAAKTIAVVVRSAVATKNPFALINVDGFTAKVAAPGLNLMAEYRWAAPQLLKDQLPGDKLKAVVGEALADALSGRRGFHVYLDGSGFARYLDSAPDGRDLGREVTVVDAPPADADLVVTVDAKLNVATGRGSSRKQTNEDHPVEIVWGQPVVQTDVLVAVEVRDRQGNLLFGGEKGTLGFHHVRQATDMWMVIQGVDSIEKLDAWAESPALPERVKVAVVQALGAALPALVPHDETNGR